MLITTILESLTIHSLNLNKTLSWKNEKVGKGTALCYLFGT